MPNDPRPGYRPRIVDTELDDLMPALAAISIEGAKAVGKSATAARRANTTYELDDPAIAAAIVGQPSLLATGDPPILIDEWQRIPSSWDVVRRAVDADNAPGRFLLTGSSAPADAPSHSGAGRIVRIHMRPMSLAERAIEVPTVSLGNLLQGGHPDVSGSTTLTLTDYIDEIVASGLPGIRGLGGRGIRAALDGYIARIVERDFPESGHRTRNPGALRRWMTAYASMISTTASFESIRAAATAGDAQMPARSTVEPYRNVLEQLWILEPVPAWLPTTNRVSRLGAAPKHQLFDPAIAVRLLGLDGPGLLRAGTTLGAAFESLVTQSVRVYAQAAEARVNHLRLREPNEHEVDLIVERQDGRVLAIEVKLAQAVRAGDVRHLTWLKDRLGDDLLDAIVVTTGPLAYRRSDGIAVVPAALLGP